MKPLRFKFNLSYPLTVIGSLLFIILTTRALVSLWDYVRLGAQVEATIDAWNVVKKSSSAFPIEATYHFEFQEKTYQGTSALLPPYHLNQPAAEKEITRLGNRRQIWINPKNPSFSALQKKFPMKKVIYALMALAITGYFAFLETTSKTRHPTN